MLLSEFILENVEPILLNSEAFDRSLSPSILINPNADKRKFRDHAADILSAIAHDMASDKLGAQQSDNSEGIQCQNETSINLALTSKQHDADRYDSQFDVTCVIAEYRALRRSVIRLWQIIDSHPDSRDIQDIIRFNASIDQSLAKAVQCYSKHVKQDRDTLLANEQTAKSDAEIADRAKDMFLATLSHELRTPLNAIVGWISILRLGGAENLAEGLDVIERNTKTQVQLIDDILDVSRIISGKLHLEMADCNLVSAINAGIDNVRPASDAKNISIEGAFDSTANRAFCDEVRIQQVIWNLLTNAIKFSNKGSHILVTLSRESSKIRIAVSDEGQGISEDLLPFVFDRFRQADSSTRRKFGGLGLGLSIVKHLTEMHGGTVEAKSDGVGLGSTFSVHLPIKPVLIKDIEAEVSKGTSGDCIPRTDYTSHGKNLAGLHLLVVDDEPDARRMLVKVLGGLGARVTSAASATEAIDVLADTVKKNDRPDVLISDIGMPNQDGYDLIQTIRQLGHRSIELPAIALTAFAREADSAAAVLAVFQVYHCKPVDIGELTASIVKLAGRIG